MEVFIVTQKPDDRIRGVFSTKEAAEEYIGPQKVKPIIKCDC
jgi:hypothetical protein